MLDLNNLNIKIFLDTANLDKIKDSLNKKGAVQEMFKFSQNGLEVWTTKR